MISSTSPGLQSSRKILLVTLFGMYFKNSESMEKLTSVIGGLESASSSISPEFNTASAETAVVISNFSDQN